MRRCHDALHVREIGLRDASDQTIYERAIAEQRVIITQDVDFGHLLAADPASRGIVMLFRIESGRVSRQISLLGVFLARFAPELIPGTIAVLSDATIRIRRFRSGN